MTAPTVSVLVCTHNPREEFLARTLLALRAQTVAASDWELVLVDNASRSPLSDQHIRVWHPHARVVREESVGLTAARLRAIAEARAPLLLFVDDDNVLAPDYLANCRELAAKWPALGAWGCGRFEPEWEQPPADALAPFLQFLAVHRVPHDRWSNRLYDYEATPAGAGMCVRAEVAARYAQHVRGDARRLQLDRNGDGLAGCGDFDLAFTAIDLGLGCGVFTCLQLTHLMPRERVQLDYLRRLAEGHGFSSFLLHALRDGRIAPPPNFVSRVRAWRYRRTLTPTAREVATCLQAGEMRARRALARLTPA
jgi:glycosyltransferase involved in cell wall biosynthesis